MARVGAHPELERGKRHNVALACTAIDQLAIAPQRPFSFWRSVGPVNRRRGYLAGMELQAGCAVPTIGGGICLLTNALYQLALQCGWKIHERHGHTAAVAAIDALDATVAFPHVDLCFEPTAPTVLSAEVRGDVLVVSAWAATSSSVEVEIMTTVTALHRSAGDMPVHRVIIERVMRFRDSTVREHISDETRRQLSATQPTCMTCDDTSCDEGNALLERAGLHRTLSRA
jgi:vancomycin resistance protein VanW